MYKLKRPSSPLTCSIHPWYASPRSLIFCAKCRGKRRSLNMMSNVIQLSWPLISSKVLITSQLFRSCNFIYWSSGLFLRYISAFFVLLFHYVTLTNRVFYFFGIFYQREPGVSKLRNQQMKVLIKAAAAIAARARIFV